MTVDPITVVRYALHEAKRCRDRDACEAFCLVWPAIGEVVAAKPMDDFEAMAFFALLREERRRVETVPLVEAHCSVCDWPEPLRADLVAAGTPHFCDHCQRERVFTAEVSHTRREQS